MHALVLTTESAERLQLGNVHDRVPPGALREHSLRRRGSRLVGITAAVTAGEGGRRGGISWAPSGLPREHGS